MKGSYKMNKSLLLASMMVVALAACGKKDPAPPPAPTPHLRRPRASTDTDASTRPGAGHDDRAFDNTVTARLDENGLDEVGRDEDRYRDENGR